MQERAKNWIKFLRRYGPIARNDNMYDEHIQRSARRAKIRPIVFEHPQQAQVLSCFQPNSRPTSVILTGTAGDGKTHLCRRVWQQIIDQEDVQLDDDYVNTELTRAGEQRFTLHIIKDLSEWAPQQGAEWESDKQELMQRFCRSLFESEPKDIFLIAANDGQLIGSWRRLEQTEYVKRALSSFETLLVEDRQQLPDLRLYFYNLSRGSSAQLLDRALDAFLEHEEWLGCYNQAAGDGDFFGLRCPIRHNYELLQTSLVRMRLRELFELCDYNELHIPIRGILLMLANAVLGHPDVKHYLMSSEDVPTVIRERTVAKASLYNNIFAGNLPETRCESIPVFEYLNRFRIGHETSNRIDNILIFGEADEHLQSYFDELLIQDKFYGADESFRAAQVRYVEGADESETATKNFLSMLVSQRRGLFFKIPSAQEDELRLWELTVFKYAGEYLNRVVGALRAGRTVDQPMLARIVKGLNRIFVGMLISDDRFLYLATSISYSHARISRILRDSISVRPRKDERIEIIWDDELQMPMLQVVFSDKVRATLQLNLVRFEFLSRVAEGALPNSFSKECHEDILAFKSVLLRKLDEREERYGNVDKDSETLVFQLLELDDAGNPSEEVIEVVKRG
jgi:hypothetical protein